MARTSSTEKSRSHASRNETIMHVSRYFVPMYRSMGHNAGPLVEKNDGARDDSQEFVSLRINTAPAGDQHSRRQSGVGAFVIKMRRAGRFRPARPHSSSRVA